MIIGHFDIICTRDGKVIGNDRLYNNITTVGVSDMLNVYFTGATPPAKYYIGLLKDEISVDASTPITTAVAAEMPINTFTGYTARKEWGASITSNDSIVNDTALSYVVNSDTISLTGAFICTTSAVLSSTNNELIAITRTTATRTYYKGDTLELTYTVRVS